MGLPKMKKPSVDDDETNEPPNESCLGIQLLSENPTRHGFTFERAGGNNVNLSVDEETNAMEPTATTYRPKYSYVKPGATGGLMSDRPDEVKWTDKFNMAAPGSYEESGSLGKQVLSTRLSAGTAPFTQENRLQFLSFFAIA